MIVCLRTFPPDLSSTVHWFWVDFLVSFFVEHLHGLRILAQIHSFAKVAAATAGAIIGTGINLSFINIAAVRTLPIDWLGWEGYHRLWCQLAVLCWMKFFYKAWIGRKPVSARKPDTTTKRTSVGLFCRCTNSHFYWFLKNMVFRYIAEPPDFCLRAIAEIFRTEAAILLVVPKTSYVWMRDNYRNSPTGDRESFS